MKRLLLLACCFLAGCNPAKLYVQADRSTYEAVSPEYRSYVGMDGRLSDEQKARRYRLLEAWDYRIRAAEGVR